MRDLGGVGLDDTAVDQEHCARCRKFQRQQAQRTLPPRNALGDPWRSVTPLEQLGSDIRQVSEHITIITSIPADRPPQDILQRIRRHLTSRRAKPRTKPGQMLPCRANISIAPNAVLDLQSPNPIKSCIRNNGTYHYTAAVSIL